MLISRQSLHAKGVQATVLVALGGAALLCAAELRTEAEVRTITRLTGSAITAADPPFAKAGERELPARAALLLGLAQTRSAMMSVNPAERAARIDDAKLRVSQALDARPAWGEAWVVATYLSLLTEGPGSETTRRDYAESLRYAPYLYKAAAWRLRYGVSQWGRLPADTQRAMLNEAAWLSRLPPSGALRVERLLGNSPAAAAYYARFPGSPRRYAGPKTVAPQQPHQGHRVGQQGGNV